MTSTIDSDFASSRYFYDMVENREHYGHSSQIDPIILKCKVKRFANKDIGKQSRQEDKVKCNIKFRKKQAEVQPEIHRTSRGGLRDLEKEPHVQEETTL